MTTITKEILDGILDKIQLYAPKPEVVDGLSEEGRNLFLAGAKYQQKFLNRRKAELRRTIFLKDIGL